MTLLIKDTFAGPAGGTIGAPPYRGNLYVQNKQGLIGPSDHVSESGHIWLPGSNAEDLKINGSGGVIVGDVPYNGVFSIAWCPTEMPTADYYVEVDVNIPANDGDSYFALFAKIQSPPNPDYGAENSSYVDAHWFPVNSTYTEAVEIFPYGNLGTYQATNLSAGVFGDHSFRLEVRGATAYILTDGLLRATRAITGSIPRNGWVGFGARSRTDDGLNPHIIVKEFRAGTLTGEFWTGHNDTREIE